MTGKLATATCEIRATPAQVWAALTEPDQIEQWMYGSRVETSWQVGSAITWSGQYDGHAYQDRGEVLVYDEPRALSVTHYSPLMTPQDRPENYHTIVYTLDHVGETTRVTLTQDGCADEEQAEQFSKNWQQMLDALKAHTER